MTIENFKKSLTAKDVTSICDAAKLAWDKASGSARTVTFVWKKRKFKSKLTSFRMVVETMNGEPIAERYH